jgi:hypothetical protein
MEPFAAVRPQMPCPARVLLNRLRTNTSASTIRIRYGWRASKTYSSLSGSAYCASQIAVRVQAVMGSILFGSYEPSRRQLVESVRC